MRTASHVPNSQCGAITSQAQTHRERSTCPTACPGALLYFAGAVQAPVQSERALGWLGTTLQMVARRRLHHSA